jgi:hypothetical protein
LYINCHWFFTQWAASLNYRQNSRLIFLWGAVDWNNKLEGNLKWKKYNIDYSFGIICNWTLNETTMKIWSNESSIANSYFIRFTGELTIWSKIETNRHNYQNPTSYWRIMVKVL